MLDPVLIALYLYLFDRKTQSRPEISRNDGIAVVVHDVVVAGPVTASSLAVAKALASEGALKVLKNPDAEKSLSRICDCARAMNVDSNNTAGGGTSAG